MSEYPQITEMMRRMREREMFTLTGEVERSTTLKEELAELNATIAAKRERLAEIERWLRDFGA